MSFKCLQIEMAGSSADKVGLSGFQYALVTMKSVVVLLSSASTCLARATISLFQGSKLVLD